jgi:hypothetical protein
LHARYCAFCIAKRDPMCDTGVNFKDERGWGGAKPAGGESRSEQRTPAARRTHAENLVLPRILASASMSRRRSLFTVAAATVAAASVLRIRIADSFGVLFNVK